MKWTRLARKKLKREQAVWRMLQLLEVAESCMKQGRDADTKNLLNEAQAAGEIGQSLVGEDSNARLSAFVDKLESRLRKGTIKFERKFITKNSLCEFYAEHDPTKLTGHGGGVTAKVVEYINAHLDSELPKFQKKHTQQLTHPLGFLGGPMAHSELLPIPGGPSWGLGTNELTGPMSLWAHESHCSMDPSDIGPMGPWPQWAHGPIAHYELLPLREAGA